MPQSFKTVSCSVSSNALQVNIKRQTLSAPNAWRGKKFSSNEWVYRNFTDDLETKIQERNNIIVWLMAEKAVWHTAIEKTEIR